MRLVDVKNGVVENVIDAEFRVGPWADWPEATSEVGPGWTFDGSDFVPPVVEVRPVFPTRDAAQTALIDWISSFEDRVTGKRSIGEKLSWIPKEAAAHAYKVDAASDAQKAVIDAEAGLLGITGNALCDKIIAKADIYHPVAAQIAGLRGATEVALDAVTDPHDYEVVLAASQAQAQAVADGMGL